MRDKKKTTEKTPEREALEKHVDAMMDPKQPDSAAETAAIPEADRPEPAITAVAIPADDAPKTAPQLSSKLKKQAGVAAPLSIDKLDELTKSITESDGKPPKKSKKANEKPEKAADNPEEPAAPKDAEVDSMELDDADTDKAVDDIVAYEGDVMLAVADSTAEEHNREVAQAKPKKRHIFSTLFWTLITLLVILIIVFCVLLVMGDNLANKLGI